ncbi:aminotransferase class III-fold pyridoxal phosphate-dependent enzyme [Actinomycetospora lutea]|uniref:aminotransferase class III-fold pyridoxal phosphate-dependent enzyme n=1 Tax=Actinomycetospora lutea TaxID=663604 RepID=UPI0023655797|nr:aminotransferase class III-fold pyridoxal phosphate-dependent enzyme [Actinomycetospora lutea]MDD7938081.1 aminotransferase class III-fold pyridoxal phosphate-dependent enzyme [Actinomycetospora lutea]
MSPFPFRVQSASGSRLIDVDGHTLIDFCGDFTAGLLGHTPSSVAEAVRSSLNRGWSFGATTTTEIRAAELVCARFESIQQVRFTHSGTEANLFAIAAALNFAQRDRVLVFDNSFHGGVISFLPDSQRMNVPHNFLIANFNDLDSVEEAFASGPIGCVVVEPVQGAGGCIPASREFLDRLRKRCSSDNTVLIFDEIMTSRLHPRGAQALYGVQADLTTLGKYLAGGTAFGAFGGQLEIMKQFDMGSGGLLAHSGTFNNNSINLAVAVAVMSAELSAERIESVNRRGDLLRERLNDTFSNLELPLWVTGLGSMLHIHCVDSVWYDWLFYELLEDGFYVSPKGFIGLSFEIGDLECEGLVESVAAWGSRAIRMRSGTN